jgi:hypothetical protein
MANALAETATAMHALDATASADAARVARESLRETRTVINTHLAHEENELEPLMAPHLKAPQWHAVEKKLRSDPLRVIGPFFAWLTDGMSDEGRTCLRSTIPPPVVFVLSRGFGRRYHREIAPVWQ